MGNQDFRNRIRYEQNEYNTNYTRGYRKPEHRYTAPRGTRERAKQASKHRNLRVAAFLMAASIGLGTIALKGCTKTIEEPNISITEIGVEKEANLGLNAETIQSLKECGEFFKNSQGNIYEQDLLDMISKIDNLHFSVVKEKVSKMLGVNPEDITMYYGTRDGQDNTRIVINENKGDRQVYSVGDFLQRKNTIPKEIADTIKQLDDVHDLKGKIISDKISKSNAKKELQKLFEGIEDLAISDLIIDEKGNISVISYGGGQEKNIEQEEKQ